MAPLPNAENIKRTRGCHLCIFLGFNFWYYTSSIKPTFISTLIIYSKKYSADTKRFIGNEEVPFVFLSFIKCNAFEDL